MAARVLWIEGRRADSPAFVGAVKRKGYQIELAPSGKAALERLDVFKPDLVVVNAASLRSNGVRICSALRREMNGCPLVLICSPEFPAPADAPANEILTLPFTARKLINRIKAHTPGESERMLRNGPIMLDMERLTVECGERKERLTPRLAELLKLLMQHAGEVLARKDLFTAVWKTEWTGDTRTLDVHVSWLRQKIEADPRRPKYLKTIRGLGYRLDLDK